MNDGGAPRPDRAYRVTDPRVADLVVLGRSLSADNAAALADCTRIGSR